MPSSRFPRGAAGHRHRHASPRRPPQRGRDVGRIVLGVRKPSDVSVGAVADHQRYAAFSQRAHDAEEGGRHHGNYEGSRQASSWAPRTAICSGGLLAGIDNQYRW